MEPLYKYPRTRHIEGSGIQTGDEDLQVAPWSELAGKHLVVEEKIDGANCAISFDGVGRLLLQSTGFDAPREAGQAIARLQKEAGALEALAPRLAPLTDADAAEAAAALQALAAAADT